MHARKFACACFNVQAFAEGGRALLYDLAKMGDYMVIYKTKEERDRLDKGKMGLLTPIGKVDVWIFVGGCTTFF